jgi:hypothetical protein
MIIAAPCAYTALLLSCQTRGLVPEVDMPKRKRISKQPRHKPAKSGAQSSSLRHVLAHAKVALSKQQSPEDAEAIRAALANDTSK